jgi:VWFA-related protein
MKVFPILTVIVAAAILAVVPVVSAQLPSAPSAVREAENKAKATPAPASEPSQPPPATAEPSGSSPASQQPSNPAPAVATPKTAALPADSGPPPDAPLPTIRSFVDEVNVIFTVTDKHGSFVKDLTQADFRVLDDKQPPRQIVTFSRETNLPLRVGLLVDASSSIRDRFKFEQDSAIEFLNQIVRPKFDRAFVIGFDTTPEVTADFTDDAEQLSHGVRMLRPGGGTALYDAVYYACRDKLMKSGAPGGSVRKAIVLLSDGDDNQSRVTREEAIAMAQRAEVIIYTISTNSSGYKEKGDKVLERMSEATGGRAFFPFKAEDVASAFSEIQDELRSQYVIAYKPLKFVADGHYHSIEILVANRKNLTARARQGYFAPKP